jgi:hypothetical protein
VQAFVPLQAEPKPDVRQASFHDGPSERVAREPDALAERLEPVRQLLLVPLRPAEELDAGEALRGRVFDRVQCVHEAW